MCSRKKKLQREEEMRRLAAERAALEAQQQAEAVPQGPRVIRRKVQSVPIAPPADFIQLTPVVQPISLVPYSTQEQPLLTLDEYED